MTLEGVDALLLWVGALIMGLHEFQFVFVFIHNNVLELLGAFIFHFVDSWKEATILQVAEIFFFILRYFQQQNGFSWGVQ